MNVMAARPADLAVRGNNNEDLMTRRQVAYLFRVTPAAVAHWARRGRLHEVRDQSGRPRYRRCDVEDLLQSGPGRRTRVAVNRARSAP